MVSPPIPETLPMCKVSPSGFRTGKSKVSESPLYEKDILQCNNGSAGVRGHPGPPRPEVIPLSIPGPSGYFQHKGLCRGARLEGLCYKWWLQLDTFPFYGGGFGHCVGVHAGLYVESPLN